MIISFNFNSILCRKISIILWTCIINSRIIYWEYYSL